MSSPMACSTIIQHNGYIGRVRVEISQCVHKLDVGYESQSEQVQFFWKMAKNLENPVSGAMHACIDVRACGKSYDGRRTWIIMLARGV